VKSGEQTCALAAAARVYAPVYPSTPLKMTGALYNRESSAPQFAVPKPRSFVPQGCIKRCSSLSAQQKKRYPAKKNTYKYNIFAQNLIYLHGVAER